MSIRSLQQPFNRSFWITCVLKLRLRPDSLRWSPGTIVWPFLDRNVKSYWRRWGKIKQTIAISLTVYTVSLNHWIIDRVFIIHSLIWAFRTQSQGFLLSICDREPFLWIDFELINGSCLSFSRCCCESSLWWEDI